MWNCGEELYSGVVKKPEFLIRIKIVTIPSGRQKMMTSNRMRINLKLEAQLNEEQSEVGWTIRKIGPGVRIKTFKRKRFENEKWNILTWHHVAAELKEKEWRRQWLAALSVWEILSAVFLFIYFAKNLILYRNGNKNSLIRKFPQVDFKRGKGKKGGKWVSGGEKKQKERANIQQLDFSLLKKKKIQFQLLKLKSSHRRTPSPHDNSEVISKI